jgi:hypothetical protein
LKDAVRVILSVLLGLLLLSSPSFGADLIVKVVHVLDGDTIEVLHNQHPERIRLSGIDCQAMRAIGSERPAELLIPHGEVDAELCPNEKMVDESRFFNVHGCGVMDKSFQSHPVIWAHPNHAHRDPRRLNPTDYR